MNGNSPRLRLLSLGLQVKLAGLGLFLASPLLFLVAWQAGAGLVVLAALVDFGGRCLCLASPIGSRFRIVGSVACQGAGFAALAVCVFTTSWIGLAPGLTLAIVAQGIAAWLFTGFLRELTEVIGRPETSAMVRTLRTRLLQSLAIGTGTTLYAVLVSAVALVVGIAFWGVGLFLTVPMGALMLAPFVLMAEVVILSMQWAYGSALLQVRSDLAVSSVPGLFPADDDRNPSCDAIGVKAAKPPFRDLEGIPLGEDSQ